MTRIIALANQKGGCAKTTTAVNIARGLTLKKRRVLLLDMDPQANATSVFADTEKIKNTIYNIIFDKVFPKDVVMKTDYNNLFLIPSDIELSAADLKLSDKMGREKILSRNVKSLFSDYHYIIIDTPPSLGLLTINSLTTAKEVIIPISVSYFAMKGVKLLMDTISAIKDNLDQQDLKISGVVCTMYEPITNVSKSALSMIKDYFGDLVMKTAVRKNVKLEEANSAGKPIFDYDPSSNGAADYMELTKEVIAYE